MQEEFWNQIETKLHSVIKDIFLGYDLENLNNYEKRRVIFDYLCGNVKYDYEFLDQIVASQEGRLDFVSRDARLELLSVVNDGIGICNGISQYYKLLLEQVGIASHCVICDDGTSVKHQLTLVFDEEKDCYSFDDVTSVIVERGDIDDFFDYDLETANSFNQGNKIILSSTRRDNKWIILPQDYIDNLVMREETPLPSLKRLPTNISSVKLQTVRK